MNTRTIYRSSITGRLITKEEAEANPDTTTKETVRVLSTTRVKESLSYLLDTLQDKATEDEQADIEQLKTLI